MQRLAVTLTMLAAIALSAAAFTSRALLLIVPFVMNLPTLVIFGHLHVSLFVVADTAIGAGTGFHSIVTPLTAFEATSFAIGQLAGTNALLNALLLIGVALNIGLHAL